VFQNNPIEGCKSWIRTDKCTAITGDTAMMFISQVYSMKLGVRYTAAAEFKEIIQAKIL
jgi:hypothetical protein